MSVVVEAIEGVADFAGKVVEGILDDPLTAIATAAAFSMGIPFLGLQSGALAAGVANTAAGLVQGEDFDEALKGGVMAGVGSWAGQQIAGAFGSTADDALAAAGDDVGAAAAKNAVASSGDDVLAAAADDTFAAAADDTFAAAADDTFAAAADAADDTLAQGLRVRGADVGDSMRVPSQDYLQNSYADASSYAGKNLGSGTMTDYAGSNAVGDVIDDTASAASKRIIEAQGTINKGVLDSDILTKGTNYTPPYTQIPDAGTYTGASMAGDVAADAAGKSVSGFFKNMYNQAGDLVDDAGNYLSGVYEKPLIPTATVVGTAAGLKYLSDKKDGEEDEAAKQKEEEMRKAREEAERRFEEPLPVYELKRNVYTPYTEEELMSYGEDPYGEGKFFSQSVYEPYYGYADGGAVMPQQMQGQPQQPKAPSRVNPAFAFYRYGNVPDSVRRYEGGGYAHGGSRGDGRSDHIEALLSPGEFVMDAETVSLLGNGSSEAGARRLEEMRQAVRKQKGGALSKGKFSPDAKSPLAYLSKKR